MKQTLKIILLSMAIVLQCSCKSTPIEIRLNLEKGKEYTQNTISTVTTKIGYMDGQAMDMSVTITGKISYLIEDVSDTAYIVEVKYKKLSMTMKTPQGSMTFDSESANDIMSSSFNFLVDNPFKIVLLKTGKVLSIDMTSFWDRLETSMTDFSLPSVQQEQIVEQIKQAYGEKAFKGNFEQLFSFFPDKPVEKGGKWQTQIELHSNFPAIMNSEYKLTKIAKDYLVIIGTSNISTNGLQDAIMQSSNGEAMKYDLTGTATSNIIIDRNTGWIIEADIKQSMKGKSMIGDMEMIIEMIGDMGYTQ